MENLGYLFAAYIVIWLGISGYVFRLSQRQKDLEEEVNTLKRNIVEKRSPTL